MHISGPFRVTNSPVHRVHVHSATRYNSVNAMVTLLNQITQISGDLDRIEAISICLNLKLTHQSLGGLVPPEIRAP